jgi:hypothetical protein
VRTFDVLAWTESGSFVLYVPDIEALTRTPRLAEVEAAATDLISELLGLEPSSFEVRLTFRRPRR